MTMVFGYVYDSIFMLMITPRTERAAMMGARGVKDHDSGKYLILNGFESSLVPRKYL